MPPATAPEGADAELTLRLRQQALVAEFAGFVLQTDELQPVLDEACRVAAEGMDCPFAKVLEHRPADSHFLLRAGIGWRPGVVGHATLGEELASPAGYAFKTGEPVLANRMVAETRFAMPALLVEHGVHSVLNVLVARPGRAFGVLEVDSSERDAFTGPDTAFLQALAAMLANAVAKQERFAARVAAGEAKDLLLLEVHHRVKNSLQLVQNLLSLQARVATDAQTRDQLNESAGRVLTIAAIHDRLYRTGAALTVEVGPYVEGLVADLRAGMASTLDERSITVDADAANWPAAEMPTLGLVLTELVTNALKYGAGTIAITFRQPRGANATLRVCDEGTALPADFDPARSRGLGMRLINGLLTGPRAGLRVERRDGGTCFTAHLPPPRDTGAAA